VGVGVSNRKKPPRDSSVHARIRVIDGRTIGWFWVPNQVIDDYGAKIDPIGVAVYCVLARFADNATQSCYPSIAKIAKLLGISDNTVKAKLEVLSDGRRARPATKTKPAIPAVKGCNLVDIKRGRREVMNGKVRNQPNLYTLLSPGSATDPGQPVTHLPGSIIDPWVGQRLPTNKTQFQDPPPIPETGQIDTQAGGREVGEREPEHVEQVIRELVKYGVARTQHTLRIAAKIARHAPNLDVTQAVIAANAQDVRAGKARNPTGAMLTRLDGMTPDDWKQSSAARVVIAREREE